MLDSKDDKPAPTSVRGWLSDVYFPALLEPSLSARARLLGNHASLDDPLFGHAAGAQPIAEIARRRDELLIGLIETLGSIRGRLGPGVP